MSSSTISVIESSSSLFRNDISQRRVKRMRRKWGEKKSCIKKDNTKRFFGAGEDVNQIIFIDSSGIINWFAQGLFSLF